MPARARRPCGLFLLHFEPRYHHAGHYLGYAKRNVYEYARSVANGTCLRYPHELVEAAVQWGMVEIVVADTWPGWGREEQIGMRRQGGLSRFCPVCRETGIFHR